MIHDLSSLRCSGRTLLKALLLLVALLSVQLGGGGDMVASEPIVTPVAARHPVSVVEADIYVNRFRTIMRLKCFAEDLELLQGVQPLDNGEYDNEDLRGATEDHAKYLQERITIRDKDGVLLKPRLIDTIHIEFPEEPIRSGKLMEYTIGFEFEFKYDEPQEFITIQQDMVAEGQLLPSEFKVLLKQAGSDTPYVKMMKPEQPETFRFDWDRPVLNQEDSEQEWEEWFDAQREKTLGIMSYSSVYSFIYITDYEVRHEVLIPLATLTTMIDIERAEENFLDVDEQDAAAERIRQFFSIGNPVTIDGVEVQPVFDRIDFYGLDLRDFAIQAERRKISMASGRVGLIMSYSTKGRPSAVSVTWDKFNDVVKSVDGVVFHDDEVDKTQFSMFLEDNTYRWTAPEREPLPELTGISSQVDLEPYRQPVLSVPIVSVSLIGLAFIFGLVGLIGWGRWPMLAVAGVLLIAAFATGGMARTEVAHPFQPTPVFTIGDSEAEQIFAQLHKNLFRAFDYHDRSRVYEALAKSVDGDLLRQLYLDINQSMKVEEQGGAIARIQQVELLSGEKIPVTTSIKLPANGPGEIVPIRFAYRCDWALNGTIEHWGHIHQRENRYEADFVVELVGDAWKITQMQVINVEPGVVKTSLREF